MIREWYFWNNLNRKVSKIDPHESVPKALSFLTGKFASPNRKTNVLTKRFLLSAVPNNLFELTDNDQFIHSKWWEFRGMPCQSSVFGRKLLRSFLSTERQAKIWWLKFGIVSHGHNWSSRRFAKREELKESHFVHSLIVFKLEMTLFLCF